MRRAGRLALVVLAAAAAACTTPRATSPTTTSSTGTPSTTVAGIPGTVRFAAPQQLAPGTGLAAVSCGSPTACVALDTQGRAYAFNGSTWSGAQTVAATAVGTGGTISVSCASSTLCEAAPTGGNETVTWNGQNWSAPSTVDGANGIEGVGCAPSGYSAAVDGEGNAFAFSGGSWHGTSGDWGAVTAISCVSSSFCVSSSGGLSMWGGGSWTQPNTYGVHTSFTGVSCPTAGFCTAVDELGQAVQWNGQAWSAPTTIETSGLGSPTGVSCPTSSFCVAVDNRGGVVQWHAGTWTRTDADGTEAISSVSCPTATFCMAVDRAGDALTGRP